MNHPKACPPHTRVIYCSGCNEYVDLAGVTCTGNHLGDAACASAERCPRCSDEYFEGDPEDARPVRPADRLPAEPEWCSHCNGYGSSLKEEADRCSHCGGSGLATMKGDDAA